MTDVVDLRIMVKRIAQIGGFSYLNCDNRYGDGASCADWLVQI